MTKTIKLLYCLGPNFGDLLNVDLIETLFCLKVVRTDKKKCDLVAIGSILERMLDRKRFRFSRFSPKKPKPVHVWGTGFIRQPPRFNILIRPLIIHSTRGYISLERLRKLTGQTLNDIVIGDPGLLAPMLLKHSVEKQYKLGIIPHHSERNFVMYKYIQNNVKDSKIIDVAMPVMDVIKEIAKCETILSTALHGLIVADSFNIPNQWAVASDLEGGAYKFLDYYTGYDIKPKPFDLKTTCFTNDNIAEIHANYKVAKADVEQKQKALIKSFPKEFLS